jgi:hypothetical protein
MLLAWMFDQMFAMPFASPLQCIAWRGNSLLEAAAGAEFLRTSAQFLEEVEIDLIDPDET